MGFAKRILLIDQNSYLAAKLGGLNQNKSI